MHKIFEKLTHNTNISNLVLFLDEQHPEILKESFTSTNMDSSFFCFFSFGMRNNYEDLKSFYNLSLKYGYTFKNNFNNKNKEKNDLNEILSLHFYNEQFIIDCLYTLNREDRIHTILNNHLLLLSFNHSKLTLLKELENYPEVWCNQVELNTIKDYYLKTFQLSDIFFKNTNNSQSDPESVLKNLKNQCRSFIQDEIKRMEKYNENEVILNITKYLNDMSKQEGLFTTEFKEEIVGLSLSSPQTKVTNAVLKSLFGITLSSYKPEKPLWIHFEHLQNKSFLYQFLDNFHWSDYWEDTTGVKHYKIDYLEKALSSMRIKLETKFYLRDNESKRNIAVTNIVLPLIADYWTNELDGVFGFTRESLKKESSLKKNMEFTFPSEENLCKKFLNQTILYKENNEYVFLNKIGYNLDNMNGLIDVIEKDYLTHDVLKIIVEKFTRSSFDQKTLELLKEKIIEHKIILDKDKLSSINTYGNNQTQTFLNEIITINNFHLMEKELSPTNKNKTKYNKI